MTISTSFICLSFLTLLFKTLLADPLDPSSLTLYGDANLINTSTSTFSFGLGLGGVVYQKPIKIYAGTPKKMVSFSTYFAFHLSLGSSLSFDMFPGSNGSFGVMGRKLLSVEFEKLVSGSLSVKVMNLSYVSDSVNDSVNDSLKMNTWIDYEAGSKRLEVRVSKLGENRPVEPVLFVLVDFWKIWPRTRKVYVGLSSLNRSFSQVDSWRFKASIAPDWMHSQPLDPTVLNQGHEVKVLVPKEERDCVFKILVALILGIGCGALGVFVGMFICTVMSNRKRRPVVPEEFAVKSLQEYEHKKLKIVLDEASANEK